ncbi:unnamed protein product [Ambrosiozyma monospora]|uniref:Unnamed protein product n=1 Tax=Ambrosiozyma monospora TaxID=43982 RepID=A0ACB5TCH4_AMBMO|nr:unnamed protein product [Ambrosiozyma monospora]
MMKPIKPRKKTQIDPNRKERKTSSHAPTEFYEPANKILEACKPLWLVCAGPVPDEIESSLREKYEEFLKKVNSSSLGLDNSPNHYYATIDDEPILLVKMQRVSIEHLFDEKRRDSYKTQSILRQVYIYHTVYQKPILISDGFHHFMIWFAESSMKIAKHPSFYGDLWKVFFNEAVSKSVNEGVSGKGDSNEEKKEKEKKRLNPIDILEIQYTYMKMTNTNEGFTVKKKFLALMYDEFTDQAVYDQVTYIYRFYCT